jgi:hypothetical protein
MIKPTIHLNGTSAESLLDLYVEAGQRLNAALVALCEAYPNQRDYYVQAPSAFADAKREHDQRVTCLRGVLPDLQALAEHCAESTP